MSPKLLSLVDFVASLDELRQQYPVPCYIVAFFVLLVVLAWGVRIFADAVTAVATANIAWRRTQ